MNTAGEISCCGKLDNLHKMPNIAAFMPQKQWLENLSLCIAIKKLAPRLAANKMEEIRSRRGRVLDQSAYLSSTSG